MHTATTNDTRYACPYCGRPIYRPSEIDHSASRLRERLAEPTYVETRVRDINVGLVLGLAVVLFMDIGVVVRPEFSSLGFATNVLIAAAFTILLPLWYWRMRVDTAAANAERLAAYERRWAAWTHTYWCASCDAAFHRDASPAHAASGGE